jgi:hypothetical protein
MKFRVRNQDGELTFESFGAVEQAWLQEILEDGATKWRKAKSFPLLAQARRHGDAVWGGTQALWIFATVALGSFALYTIINGRWWIALLVTVVLCLILGRVTYQAFNRSKPHRF